MSLIHVVEDHLGNKYAELKDMCEHYDIQPYTYCH